MNKIIKISSAVFLALLIIFTGCKKKEEVVPQVPASAKFNTTPYDSSAMFVMHDTLYAPAHDNGSRTFFNSKTLTALTANQIDANLSLSDSVIFGYFFSTNDTTGGVLANTYAYFDTTITSGWHKTTTIFRKSVPLASYTSAATSNDITNAWNAATPYTSPGSGGFIYKLAVDQVYAYTTQGKIGLIRIISMIPGNNPYADYVLFEIKMQK
jgi:hypothetical protein